jgi:prepilin-type processing-associated H-X9-DG protein
MGIGWGYQILPFLEENSVHNLTRNNQLTDVVIPLYICPSKRGIVRSESWGGVSVVLMDYAGTHPCTTRSTGTNTPPTLDPLDPSSIVGVNGRCNMVRDHFEQAGGGGAGPVTGPPPDSVSHEVGPSSSNNGVYDGVIVRCPWRHNLQQDPAIPGFEGQYAKNPTFPTKFAKVTDGTSKTMLIGEKQIRTDLYTGGTSSDDRGWADGWDPDTMRSTCIQPMSDSETDIEFTGTESTGDHAQCWYTMVFGSSHPGGFNAVFADGSVHSISYDIDVIVFNSLGTRNGTAYRESSSSEGVN